MLFPIRRFAVALALLGAAGAAPAASPCAAGGLLGYVGLGAAGCSVGALTFSDFGVQAFPGPTSQQIAPSGVSLAPVAGGLSLSDSTALAAGPGTLLGLRIVFNVAAPALTGGTVSLGAAAAASVDGAVTGLLGAGSAGTAIGIVVDGFSEPTASFGWASSTSYAASFELGIDGGTAGSARLGPALASLTFASGTVITPVPEPSPAWMIGVGVLSFLLVRRRLARSD